jgi:hypothetical protein
MSIRRWQLVNVLVLMAVIALNGLAASGAMSGDSIGVIANRYRSLFLPADYVFGIWSLIYLGLIASTVYQALPTAGAARAVERLGVWWAVTGALNVAWLTLFSFGQFALALVVMLVFLATLVMIGERIRRGPLPTLAERAFVIWPQDLYLAWISVALIANSFQVAHVVGFGGLGIPESTWAVGMMGVATLLGAVMAWGRGNWLFPLTVAWAVRGIGARYADLPAIAVPSAWLVPVGMALGAVAWWVGARRRA